MTSSANYYPDFFIFFLPEQRSQRMIIPKAFLEFTHLKEKLPEDVVLRDHRSGRVWHVKARFIGDKLCLEFDDGWKQFRKENNLNKADFLVFSYDGNKEFKFKIFDLSSGCERMKVKEEEVHGGENDYMMEENIKEEAEENFGYIEIREEDEHEDKDSEMKEEEEEDDDKEDDGDKDDSDEDDTEMEEENKEEYSGNKRSQCNSGASKANVLYIRGTASTSAPKIEDPELEDYEDVAEMCVHPDNPYFVAKHLKHKLNMLHIPKAIITQFSLSFPEKITILCCQCKNVPRSEVEAFHQILPQQTLMRNKRREVTGKVCRWKDGRLLVLGWEKFFRKHKIQQNDVCICEIVLGEDQNIKMLLVHVRCG